MSVTRDPVELSAQARALASRMQADATFCLDVAFQLVSGRDRIEQLAAELEREQRRVDALVRSMAPVPVSGGPVRRVLLRILPALAFFVAGMVAFVLLLMMLQAVQPRAAELLVPRESVR